jgi:NAD(P)-dependent dehydrogenase (short-subunit alcohol dehydrogenase family)
LSRSHKVVVITGATRGIGYNMASYFSRHGYTVVGLGRDAEKLEQLQRMVEQGEGRGAAFCVDVLDAAAVASAADQIVNRFGVIDAWINNAGVNRAIGPMWEIEAELWSRDVSINLLGTFHGIRAAVPIMIKRGSGCIINVAGGGTTEAVKYGGAYCTSKTAVARLTEALALELAESGANIRTFAMNPGLNDSDMTKHLRETELGRKYYPKIDELFRNGKAAPPDKAPELARTLIEGALDDYSGRIIGIHDQVQTLQQQATELADGHYKLRMAKK